jgi:hypothetical protein
MNISAQEAFTLLFGLAMGATILFSIFKYVQRGSYRGMMFDAKILQSYRVVSALGSSPNGVKIKKIHLLERGSERLIGLEFGAKGEAMLTALSLDEARSFVQAINSALGQSQ